MEARRFLLFPSNFLLPNFYSAFPSLRANRFGLREFAAENVKRLYATHFFTQLGTSVAELRAAGDQALCF
jgi:hypothetical protein